MTTLVGAAPQVSECTSTSRFSAGITPSGLTAAQIGGIQWVQVSGNGTINGAGTDGTGTYDV